MKYYFPPQNQNYTYLQTNRSDDLGSLWSTMNLDFQSKLGVIQLGQKLVINTSSSDDSDLGKPGAFELFDDAWFAICGTRIFKTSDERITSTFNEDASTGFITTYDSDESDLAIFDFRLWASSPGKLLSKVSDTGAWTDRTGAADLSGNTQQLLYFWKFNRLYFINTDDSIGSIDVDDVISETGDYTIDIGGVHRDISALTSNTDSIWIGTSNPHTSALGAGCSILRWDGISAQASANYIVQAVSILAMCVYNDIPYAVDSNGRILKYTGYSFEEIQRLPTINTFLTNSEVVVGSNNFIHWKGFIPTKNNTLLLAINNLNEDSGSTINENLPSGIWELDLATLNFTPRYHFTLKTRSSANITDFGQNRISGIGGIKINTVATDSSAGQGTILAGATVYTNSSTELSAIFIDSPTNAATNNEGQKKGYFVTTWFNSDEVEDRFTRLWAIYRRFLNSSDSIVFKYRLNEESPVEATITWVNTTSFTTTTDITAYGPTATGFDGVTGGEFEGTQGTGSAATAHITNIVNNGGTYTVTLDTAITGVTTGTAKARFQKWTLLNPVEAQNQIKSWSQYAIGANNTRIQIKCCMTFTGDDEFHKFAIFSNEDVKITQ